jgi:lysozyme family protein
VSFARAVAFVLAHEGSELTENEADPGGLTRYGIALKRHPELTAADIRAMTAQRAAQIYEGPQYFGAIKGYQLPDALQLPMLDAAVMSGPGEAIRWLQRALYVRDDGDLGPETLNAAAHASVVPVIQRFCAERLYTLSTLPNWAPNAVGWSTRVIASAMESA